MNDEWNLTFSAFYIVTPRKGRNNTLFSPRINGERIQISEVPKIIATYFHFDPSVYPIGIIFSSSGPKVNEVRNQIRTLASGSETERESAAQFLAEHLAASMDNKSKPGLFLVLCGDRDNFHRVVIWIFNQDITLTRRDKVLQQIDEAYPTELGYVKIAFFEDIDSNESFWKGKIEDKVNRSIIKQAADYWISDFLKANVDVTPPYGTRMISGVIQQIIDKSDSLDEKAQIIEAFEAYKNNYDTPLSVNDFAQRFLPAPISEKFKDIFSSLGDCDTKFKLDVELAEKLIGYESFILDNGIIITGPSEMINKFVDQSSENSFTISGKLIDQRLRSLRRK